MEKYKKALTIIGGILYLIFGAFHLTFFKVFSHKNPDFEQIKPLLSRIMLMLNLGLVVFFVSAGIIMLFYRNEILNSKLGKAFLVMSGVFFIIRGSAEFAFPTFKIAFVLTMFLVAAVYLVPALNFKSKN